MSYLNAEILGRIGNSVEMTRTQSGKDVLNLSVAVNDKSQKGDQVLIRGKMKLQEYTDKAGVKKRSFAVDSSQCFKIQ